MQWLSGEALHNNPKIDVTPDGTKFSFKPVYKIKDGKSLMRLLKQHDLKGLGGILLEDVQESLPHCEKVLKNRAAEILFIIRPIDKKKILFYNDRTANFSVSNAKLPTFICYIVLSAFIYSLRWMMNFRSFGVPLRLMQWTMPKSMNTLKSKVKEESYKPILYPNLLYLPIIPGIRSMQDHGLKKPVPKRKKAANKKRQFKKPRDNEHLADVLETYEDNTLTQKGANPT